MTKQLSDYEVTFRRDPLFGAWSWKATAPDGELLAGPLLGLLMRKENAERDAARRIKLHSEKETVDGQALVDRVAAASGV